MSKASPASAAAAAATPADSKARFVWEDPLLLEEQLSEEERMVRDAARAYCQDKLMPRILEANRHEIFARAIMTEMGSLGLLGATIPEAYGGAGVSLVCSRPLARECQRVHLGYPQAISMRSTLVRPPIQP